MLKSESEAQKEQETELEALLGKMMTPGTVVSVNEQKKVMALRERVGEPTYVKIVKELGLDDQGEEGGGGGRRRVSRRRKSRKGRKRRKSRRRKSRKGRKSH